MAQNSTELEEFEVFEKPLILSTSNKNWLLALLNQANASIIK